jgi:hypothetical protein
VLVREAFDVLGIGPFARGFLLKLHQADFVGSAAHVRMKPALAPNNRLYERWFHAVPLRRRANRTILAPLLPPLPPPVKKKSGDNAQSKNESEPQFHRALVPHM